MVAGIVLFALGLKRTLGHVGDGLDTAPAVGLCGGITLYLLAHIAFLFRTTGRVFRRRTIDHRCITGAAFGGVRQNAGAEETAWLSRSSPEATGWLSASSLPLPAAVAGSVVTTF
jgi:hypothetical protein